MVHFVKEHAQEESAHEQHEHNHSQTHQPVIGGKQIAQDFHEELQWNR
jgi:hypothetical protein